MSGECLLRDVRRDQDDEWLRGDFICAICSGPSGRSSHGRAARTVRAAASGAISFARFRSTGGRGTDLLWTGGRGTDLLSTDGRLLGGPFVVNRRAALERDFICAICHGRSGRSPQERAARTVRAAASGVISFARFRSTGGRGTDLLWTGGRGTDLLSTDGRLLGGPFVVNRRAALERDFICAICHRWIVRSSQERAARTVRAAASGAISFARFRNGGGFSNRAIEIIFGAAELSVLGAGSGRRRPIEL